MSAACPIAWRARGDRDASPLLLIRPLGGSMALWGRFEELLAAHLRVVSFDARGSGASRGAPRASIRSLATDALSVLDAAAIDRAHVFGISLGSLVAMGLALQAPARVRSLVLASTTSRGLAFERAGLSRGLGFARCFARTPRHAEECLVARVLSPEFHAAHPMEAARLAKLAGRVPTAKSTLAAHLFAAARWNARSQLSAVRAPTLVLAGDRDHLLGMDAGCDVARAIPRALRVVVRDAGHDLTLENADATAAFVVQHVRRVEMGLELQLRE